VAIIAEENMALNRPLALGLVVVSTVFSLGISAAQAATPVIVLGELHGARDVDVDGTLYDVDFIEGSCIGIFSGCDSPDDFTFDNGGASAALNALLDQVIAGTSFNDDPSLTYGCEIYAGPPSVNYCRIVTPYKGNAGQQAALINNNNGAGYITFGVDLSPSHDSGSSIEPGYPHEIFVYARWSLASPPAAPVPGPGLISGVGIFVVGLGLAARGLRSRRTRPS
jgi:hypothetical protein